MHRSFNKLHIKLVFPRFHRQSKALWFFTTISALCESTIAYVLFKALLKKQWRVLKETMACYICVTEITFEQDEIVDLVISLSCQTLRSKKNAPKLVRLRV